ncbi:MAG TPA: DUF4340 domain-containing protein [Bryobacteraceae bacterium]|jgi:hypothetical protein
MKPKGLLVAVVLLAVLGGAVWYSNKKQAQKEKAPTETSPKIVSIPEDQFREIRLQKTGAEPVVLSRNSGKWALTAPQPLSADPDATASLVSSLSSVTADKTIQNTATDLASFGLANPSLKVQVIKKDGKQVDLEIGDDTPTNSGAYAMVSGDPHVYTVASYVKTSLDKTANDLRDKRLLTFDSDKLTRVKLAAKGPAIVFGKNGQNEWQIVEPRPLRADSGEVDTLVSKLHDAKMDLGTPPDEAAKKFITATTVALAQVTDNSGTQTLEVRKDKDNNYYARSSAAAAAYKVAADLGEGLNKGLDDFRNKKLFDFGFSDPTKIEIKNGPGAPVTYAKSGDKWTAGSKNMDNSSVQNLIDKLRDLTATGFAEQGGGQPVFQAGVTWNSGKRNERVIVSKQGEKYSAQREGEPSIYVLDAKAVEDLEKAAGDVKEAAPAAAKKK